MHAKVGGRLVFRDQLSKQTVKTCRIKMKSKNMSIDFTKCQENSIIFNRYHEFGRRITLAKAVRRRRVSGSLKGAGPGEGSTGQVDG